MVAVTPYNGQLASVRALLDDCALDAKSAAAVEVRTVDGFQGREKEAIVMSMVRSNTRGETGFLKDARRINVAATRAKRHLAIVGDSGTLEHDAFIAALIAHARAKGSVRTPEELGFDVGAAALHQGAGAQGGASGGARRGATLPGTRSVIGGAGDDALRVRVQTFARAAMSGSLSKRALKFEAALDSGERRVVHAEAETLGLRHRSSGSGPDRYIEIAYVPAAIDASASALSDSPLLLAESPLAESVLAVNVKEQAPAVADESASDTSEAEENDASGTVSWSGGSGPFGGFGALESSSESTEEEEEGEAAPATRAVLPQLPLQGKKPSKTKMAKATTKAPVDDDWAALNDALAENAKHLPFGGDVPKHLQGLAGFNLETLHHERRGAPLTRHDKQRAAALKATLKATVAKARDARSGNDARRDAGKTKKRKKKKKKKR